MRLVPVTSSADRKAITTGPAVVFDTEMVSGAFYVFTTTVDAYISQGASPTASAGDGSVLIAAGQSCLIDGSLGAYLSVIAAGTSGAATLTRAKVLN